MGYDLEELLSKAYEEDKSPSRALNQETIAKLEKSARKKTGIGKNISGIGKFAFVCVSVCLAITVSVPAITAISTYIKESTRGESKVVEQETTTYKEIVIDSPNVKYKFEDGVLTVYGDGEMTFEMEEELAVYKESAKKIVIEEGVTLICSKAFKEFVNVESVEMADSVEVIEAWAFQDCINLKDVKLSENLTSISLDSFWGTAWMNNLQEDENGFVVVDNVILLSGENATGDIVIPDGIKVIAEYAFCDTDIESIVIPDGVIELGYCALAKCPKLKEVYVSGTVGEINGGMFYECTSLTKVVLEEGIAKIGSKAFKGCVSLENIVVPEGVEIIGEFAFEKCTNLKSVTLPASLVSVGVCIFSEVDNLETIYGYKESYAEKLAMLGDYDFVEVE